MSGFRRRLRRAVDDPGSPWVAGVSARSDGGIEHVGRRRCDCPTRAAEATQFAFLAHRAGATPETAADVAVNAMSDLVVAGTDSFEGDVLLWTCVHGHRHASLFELGP